MSSLVDPSALGRLVVLRKRGDEAIHRQGQPLPWTVQSFWQWAASDLVSNTLRGVFAEYLVACALGQADGIRLEWDAVDVRTADGLRVEVRSAAYLQTWEQTTLSSISFEIAPHRGWDAATNTSATTAARTADVYVFCLLKHEDKATVDPSDVSQWTFFVVPTAHLNAAYPIRRRISLHALLQLCPRPVAFEHLAATITGGEQPAH